MPRVLPVIGACLAFVGAAAAHAQSAGSFEFDVLDANELPSQALKRMEDAARRARAGRQGQAEAPSLGAFIPEGGLGARGLAVPEIGGLDGDGMRVQPDAGDLLDRHGDKDKDKGDKDKDPGGH